MQLLLTSCSECERSDQEYYTLCDDCKSIICNECIEHDYGLELCELCTNERLMKEDEENDLY